MGLISELNDEEHAFSPKVTDAEISVFEEKLKLNH